MKSTIYAFLGMLMYAISGVVIEQKLESFSTTALELFFVLPILPICLVWLWVMKTSHHQISMPAGSALWIVLGMGVMYFFADYFLLGAYTAGGSVIIIATIMLLTPAIATLVRYLWVGGKPNAYQISGYILVVIAMYLVNKGNVR